MESIFPESNEIEAELLRELARVDRSGDDNDDRERSAAPAGAPTGLADFVGSICRRDWVAREVLLAAEAIVMRRTRSSTPAAAAARWAKRWAPENVEGTRRLLRRLRDRILRSHHQGHLAQHLTFATLPEALRSWRPNRDGELVVSDLQIPKPSIGIPSFLEQTAPKILRWVFETFRERQRERALTLGAGLRLPRVWDLTAGSGTSIDLLGAIHGCEVVASDLTVVGGTDIALGDCRDVGTMAAHRAQIGLSASSFSPRRPDIILFDPPSRGRPTHAEIYEAGRAPSRDDLALLDPEPYVSALASTIVWAARRLAPGGTLSVVVRCGARCRTEVVPDEDLLPTLKEALAGFVRVTNEMPVVYRTTRAQTSLGAARVPTVHLLVERGA